MSDIEFEIRIITWSDYDHKSPILLQDANGPCPLIALVNTLLLNNEIQIRTNSLNGLEIDHLQESIHDFKKLLLDKSSIKLNDLLSQLGDLLIKFNDGKNHNIDKVLENLPLLHTGLSINSNLTNGTFEPDLGTELFNIFNLKVNHGWIYEFKSVSDEPIATSSSEAENDSKLDKTILSLQNFDSIQDYLLTTNDEPLKHWLIENSTQLTNYGLLKLNELVDSDEFIVFFRNNHFSTLYKKDEHDFYLLLTDSSFKNKSHIVWQSLISTSGKDDLFFNGEFLPVLDDLSDHGGPEDENLKLIKQLQLKDDEDYAKDLQKTYEKRQAKATEKASKEKDTVRSKTRNSIENVEKDKNSDKEKKKKNICIIM